VRVGDAYFVVKIDDAYQDERLYDVYLAVEYSINT
jgi:hypothetical protein